MNKLKIFGYFKTSGRIGVPGTFSEDQPHGISTALVNALDADAEITRLNTRIAELEARQIAEISSATPKLAGWIMTADDDCGADWFEFAGDHEKPPKADKFFRPVPVFFGATEGVCLGDPFAALEQIGQLIGPEGQVALAQSEHLKNLAP